MFDFKKCLLMVSICATLYALMSCGKDSSNTTSVVNTDTKQLVNSMSCDISGQFNFSLNFAGEASTYTYHDSTMILIRGSDENASIAISLNDSMIGEQSIIDKDGKSSLIYFRKKFKDSTVADYIMTDGTITITENTDKVIKGYFCCSTKGNTGRYFLAIKNGKFSWNK